MMDAVRMQGTLRLWGMLCVVVIPLLFVAISWEVVLGQSGKHRRQWRGQIDCI